MSMQTMTMSTQTTKRLWALSTALFIAMHHVAGRTSESDSKALSPFDASFCTGGLHVTYPDLDVEKCLTISQQRLREKISTEWGAPLVRLTNADQRKTYVLMMVDPDAPSHSRPTRAHWRHWLVVDIEGSSLLGGDLKGTTLSEYSRPTPPQKSGLHRYQFMVYVQPADRVLSLTTEEDSTRGNWDPEAFVARFDLGRPVAAVQFLTQNYKD